MQCTVSLTLIEESKYFNEVMKKHFNKELMMTKDDKKILRTLLNVGSVIMIILILMLKSKITVILLENIAENINCNINLKLNHKIPIVFHNLKNYDSHFIMQELGKFNLKISVIPNGLEKYMSFTINKNQCLHKCGSFPTFQ